MSEEIFMNFIRRVFFPKATLLFESLEKVAYVVSIGIRGGQYLKMNSLLANRLLTRWLENQRLIGKTVAYLRPVSHLKIISLTPN